MGVAVSAVGMLIVMTDVCTGMAAPIIVVGFVFGIVALREPSTPTTTFTFRLIASDRATPKAFTKLLAVVVSLEDTVR